MFAWAVLNCSIHVVWHCSCLFTYINVGSTMFEVCCGSIEPRKSNAFDSLGDGHTAAGTKEMNQPKTTAVVLELVGAVGLSRFGDTIDPYCVVKRNGKEVHRTKTIENDTSPIWTVKTKSLCLFDVTEGQEITVELCYPKSVVADTIGGTMGHVIAKKCVVGTINFSSETLTNGKGERLDFHLQNENECSNNIVGSGASPASATLALRFRPAAETDQEYFGQALSRSAFRQTTALLQNSTTKLRDVVVQSRDKEDNAWDIDFQHVSSGSKLLKARSKKVLGQSGEKETAFRVWPYADPDRVQETQYLTKEQLHDYAMQPSKTWVKAGDGSYGTIRLEVLGCDDLPNMDTEIISGKTDAFVACVFENSFVRSPVIHDTLCPRWMPWSHRAFEFSIEHPGSLLFLGVYDFDDGPLDHHDPIGRVVINMRNFEHDTVHHLRYSLTNGVTQEEDSRGTLSVRLQIHWHNRRKAIRAMSFAPPPDFMVNVHSEKSWRVLRYLTRGNVDMDVVTVQSVKLYANELVTYVKKYCFLLDVVAETLLWRGSLQLGETYSLWFPAHSIVLFGSLAVAVEFPEFLPSVVCFALAYALLCHNYHLSHCPDPWSRMKPFWCFLTGSRRSTGCLCKSTDSDAAMEKEKLNYLVYEYRKHRVMGFIGEFLTIGLKVYRVYSKSVPADLSTAVRSGGIVTSLYQDYLVYVHMILQLLCKLIRSLRNFVNFQSQGPYLLTLRLLLVAITWAFLPAKGCLVRWCLRAFVWGCFGPWLKILDLSWIHTYYRTSSELAKTTLPETTEDISSDIAGRTNILEPLLNSEWVHKMGKSGRIVVEDNLKLHDFRALTFGTYNERVPVVDSSRFPGVPLPCSWAEAAGQGDDSTPLTFLNAPGQKLNGTMVPMHEER